MRSLLPASRLLPCLLSCAGGTPGAPLPEHPGEVAIPAIQGRGHFSPLVGRTVATTGVVTAVTHEGFYLQDPRGDGDEATSDGLFVLTRGRAALAVGDEVRVTGLVSEFVPGGSVSGNLSSTQIAEPITLLVLARQRRLPRAVRLGHGGRIPPAVHVIAPGTPPVNLQVKIEADAYGFHPDRAGIDFYESLEAMRVVVPEPVAVSPTRTFSRSSAEAFTLPAGGKHVEPQNARTPRGGIYLQPHPRNRGDQNPEIVQIQFDADLFAEPAPAITVGDRLGDVTGIMGYGFGSFEVKVTESFEVIPGGLRPDTTPLAGTATQLTVASFNVFNLSARREHDARRAELGAQIVHNLRGPDVVALQEIQDNNGETDDGTTDASQTLRALAEAVRGAGGPSYEFFDVPPVDGTLGGAPGANIRPAFLYNPARVRLVSYRALTPSALARAGIRDSLAFKDSRNPLVAIFQFAGQRVAVINNHLTSRYGSSPIFGAVQPFVQAGEEDRAAQTRALNAYVARLLADDEESRVIVLGDLNTFEFTDDLTRKLPGAEQILTNLLERVNDESRYSYIFQGNSQLIDHIFVTENLLAGAELDIVHVNVDFPANGKVEISDHEPIVARIQLESHTRLGPSK
jgi:predicted extracellular nuclease